MSALIAAACLVLACCTWRPSRPGAARLRRLVASVSPPRERPPSRLSRSIPQVVAAAVVGLGLGVLIGGLLGLVVGVLSPVVVVRTLAHLRTRAEKERVELMRADVPLVGDLMASLLRSGADPLSAAGAVASSLDGPLAEAMDGCVRSLRLGEPPDAAWAPLMDDEVTAALVRPLVRAAERGSSAAPAMARASADLRRQARARAAAAADTVAVRAVGPLGVCFLPAFVLLAVVPLVAGWILVLIQG